MIKRFDDYSPHALGSRTDYLRACQTCSEWTSSTTDNLPRGYDREVAWGVDIPRYHERLRRGELLPFTDYVKHVITETPGSWNYRLSMSTYTYNPYAKGDNIPYAFTAMGRGYGDVAAFADADARSTKWALAQQALASIYTRGMDALTFLAELRKTVKMLVSKFRQVVDFVTSYDFRIPPKWLWKEDIRTLNSEWLEWRYGWRILIYDIMSLRDALDMPYKKTRLKERAGYQQTWAVSERVDYNWSSCNAYEPYRRSFTLNERVMVVGDFEVPPFRFNPLMTAYELVTYSFVLDWFFTVGKAIEAASLLATTSGSIGAQRESMVAGFAQKVTVETEPEGAGPFVPTTIKSPHTDVSFTWSVRPNLVEEYCRREPLDLLNPAVIMPHMHVNLTPLKVVDLLALILQRIIRK